MDLRITSPCPIDLDARGVDRSGPGFRCDHCERDVHVLSNMSREAASNFIEAHRGQKVCVSYRRDQDGRILFADDPHDERDEHDEHDAPARLSAPLVPVSRLRRAAALPRAASVALLVAACAPHGETPPPDEDPVEVLARDPAPGVHVVPLIQEEDDEPWVGEAIIEDEPCVKAPPPAKADPVKRAPAKKQREKPLKIEIVDGGLTL